MSAPSDQDIAFSESIFALLNYYRSGTIQTFHTALDKALTYAEVAIDSVQLKSLRYFLFNRMILFGFLEFSDTRGQRRWCIGPNRLIKLSKGGCLVVGDSGFIATFNCLSANQVSSYHVTYTFPSSTGTRLNFCVKQVDFEEGHERSISQKLDCPVVCIETTKLAEFLPTVESVYQSLAVRGIDPTQIDSAAEFKRFDETKHDWVDANYLELSPGLYRIPHVYGQHRDIVIKNGAHSLVGFDIPNRDWSFFLSAYLLQKSLHWKYSGRNRTVAIPFWQITLTPMLVKRVLCASTMKWPDLKAGCYRFRDVEPLVAHHLATRYPMIGMKNV